MRYSYVVGDFLSNSTNSRSLYIRRRLCILGLILAAIVLVIFIASSIIIGRYDQYILANTTDKNVHSSRVGLVLGAGITKDGRPYRELQSRLDVAADALKAGYVKRLVLSGDNRFKGYNEPQAMREYLIQMRGIDASLLQPDYAGRSTYESCERAAKVFELKQVIIFSAKSHLPRAIYLCRQFGITAYGIPSSAEANNAGRRETVARVKALFNVYVRGENTLLGPPIPLR